MSCNFFFWSAERLSSRLRNSTSTRERSRASSREAGDCGLVPAVWAATPRPPNGIDKANVRSKVQVFRIFCYFLPISAVDVLSRGYVNGGQIFTSLLLFIDGRYRWRKCWSLSALLTHSQIHLLSSPLCEPGFRTCPKTLPASGGHNCSSK